jgi:integral membrane protein
MNKLEHYIPPFQMNSPLARFRTVAFLEGSSYVLLLGTMVLKYGFDLLKPNLVVGMAHGLLFVLYCLLLLSVWVENKWSLKAALRAFMLSLVPFGTFYGEARWWRHL